MYVGMHRRMWGCTDVCGDAHDFEAVHGRWKLSFVPSACY